MDIGQEMPRHAHNSQFGGLLHCLALGWNHFVALVIFTFWWTFGSLGAILFPSKLFILSNVVCIHSTQVECIHTVKNSFIIAFFFLTLIIVFLESKHSHEHLSVCCLLLVAFFMALKSSRRGFQTLALGFHLHTDHLTSHKPSHITQSLCHRPSLSVSK